MKVFAYTGGIASGKSTLARYFIQKGVAVIDADQLAHSCYEKDSPIYQAIIKRYGNKVLDHSANIDRKQLGKIIFNQAEEKAWLESQVHPEVRKRIWHRVKKEQDKGKELILVEAALMIESGLHKDFDGVIVISCDPEIQIQRVMQRDQVDITMAQKKISSQLAVDEKIKYADFHIDNSGDIEKSKKQILELIPELQL